MSRTSGLLGLLTLLLTITSVAAAQSADEVAEAVEFRGYYAEGGTDVPVNELEALVGRHPDIGFVALGSEPGQGPDIFADDVLGLVEGRDTVVVLTPTDAGASSATYSSEALSEAFDVAFDDTGDSYVTDFAQLAEALESAEPEGRFPVGAAVLAGGAGLVGYGIWRRRRSQANRLEGRLEEARREIRQQMTVIANEILEFSDRVDQDQHPEAVAHFRAASTAYEQAESRLAATEDLAELEELSDDLDEARWALAAAEAIVEGRSIPERPVETKPEPCFFDPTHGAGTEEAKLETPAGSKTVRVCQADADRLRRGEQPSPRTIDVGGRALPAPQAPRTHGGRGMDWLDAFSIIVGGMNGPMSYRWPRSRGGMGGRVRPRSGGGGRPNRTRSRSRTGSRPRARSRSRSVGRARRRR